MAQPGLRSCLVVALASCTPHVDGARARAELLAVDRAFDSTVAARRLEGWVDFFSDSGRQVDRRGDFVVGHAAIREHMRGLLSDTTTALRWSPDRAEASNDGALGYTWGRWTLVRRKGTDSTPLGRGRYLTVWRRAADGRWKAEADIGNETSAE